MNKIISFPHLGNYYIPVSYFIKKITKCEVLIPPPITKKTIKLGSTHSPDYVCVPFKYNLGNFIEALDKGANVLLQAGGGCRYGYYAELQEQILRDMGYEFEFVNFIKNNRVSFKEIYKFAKKLNKKLNPLTYLHYVKTTILMIIIMDKLSDYPRKNSGFEDIKGSHKKIEKELLKELKDPNITSLKLIKIYIKYKKVYKSIKINKPKKCVKVGLVGELYSLMEPYCNSNIESKLENLGIEVHRFTTLTYLLITKKFKLKRYLRQGRKYLKYHLGADATESVVLTQKLSRKHFDGIIHIKSFGCTPEINAMPIMDKIKEKTNIPILYFSFDSQDSEVGINTRIEAFYDMLVQKKEK